MPFLETAARLKALSQIGPALPRHCSVTVCGRGLSVQGRFVSILWSQDAGVAEPAIVFRPETALSRAPTVMAGKWFPVSKSPHSVWSASGGRTPVQELPREPVGLSLVCTADSSFLCSQLRVSQAAALPELPRTDIMTCSSIFRPRFPCSAEPGFFISSFYPPRQLAVEVGVPIFPPFSSVHARRCAQLS